jgi:hypothetical protein
MFQHLRMAERQPNVAALDRLAEQCPGGLIGKEDCPVLDDHCRFIESFEQGVQIGSSHASPVA